MQIGIIFRLLLEATSIVVVEGEYRRIMKPHLASRN